MSYFSELYSSIRYPIATDKALGLRNAQIGAIHAVASHNTLEPLDAAVIVMPTGSGKTTVLILAPYILQKNKVLVVTPSALVRGQIVEEYRQLKTLKFIGVFDNSVTPPVVYEAEHLYTIDQENLIAAADVVVASHMVAASISESSIHGLFDYVIIDEAHHVPAPTWQKILANMKGIAALLVTATPFRLDKKEIQGTHIYNYPLSRAYHDGIFGTITFIPIEEAPEKDLLIAKEAERVLLNDRENGYDHYLMVRTDTKEKAKELSDLYQSQTALKLKRIDSSMSYGVVKTTIDKLKQKELDGIICVDMLGEGFDFPNLKIAAIHEPQKSLASTLQFVGRFARTGDGTVGSAKFIAMNDENLRIENRKLYTNDAVWQDIIIDMSEQKIQHELDNSEAIKKFSRPDNNDCEISLHNVRPNCHARVYRVTGFCFDNNFPDELLIGNNVFRNPETNTIVGISISKQVPLWLEGDHAINTEVNLFIVHYQDSTKLLFIYSQLKTEIIYESIVGAFCDTYSKIPRNEMNRVLAGFSSYEFFNTGMQNRHSEAGESYRIYSGSNTASSIDENTGEMLSAGHAFCKAVNNDNETTIGYSSGSKFWSSSYLSIPEYVTWCDSFGEKIVNKEIVVKTNTNYDWLPIPSSIQKYEKDILFCFFNENVYASPPSIRKNGTAEKLGLLSDANLLFKETTPNGKKVIFDIELQGISERFSCDIDGKYTSETVILVCRDGSRTIKLADYFSDHPISFKTGDDTVYCGNEVLQGNAKTVPYDTNRIISIDWNKENTNISVEAGDGKLTIQETLEKILNDDTDLSHIIFDHGSGEIADYITFTTRESTIHIGLYHCKAMKGKNCNANVADVYEVAQQAIKSTVWIKSKSSLLAKLVSRLRNHEYKYIRGDSKSLKSLLKSTNLAMEVTIYIVQPAISKSMPMEETISKILSAATASVKNSGRAKELKILGSI